MHTHIIYIYIYNIYIYIYIYISLLLLLEPLFKSLASLANICVQITSTCTIYSCTRRQAHSTLARVAKRTLLWHAPQQCRIALACSAAVPHGLLYSPHMCRVVPKRWRCELAVGAPVVDFAHKPHVASWLARSPR